MRICRGAAFEVNQSPFGCTQEPFASIWLHSGTVRFAAGAGMALTSEIGRAVGQNQWYHFGVGALTLVYFSGDWDVHWGYGLLTHDHIGRLTIGRTIVQAFVRERSPKESANGLFSRKTEGFIFFFWRHACTPICRPQFGCD